MIIYLAAFQKVRILGSMIQDIILDIYPLSRQLRHRLEFFSPHPSCQGDVGKEPQLFRGRGPLKVEEVSLTKLRPGWRQVVVTCCLYSNRENARQNANLLKTRKLTCEAMNKNEENYLKNNVFPDSRRVFG